MLYRKVKRFRSLDPRKLAVLRELAMWRDIRAREHDRNRRAIAADEVLVEIARAGPRDPKALGRTRGLHNETITREGAAIIAAVERGQAVPEDAWPRPNEHRPAVEGAELAAAIVQAFLKVYCQELRIDSSMVGTTADVERLVADYAEGRLANSEAPLLQGWRGELVGERVVAFLRGELAVRLEPGTVRPVFEPVVS
jgi:ribonuclease D